MAPPPDYRAIAAQKAQQYGVPVDVFLRQIAQESGFRPDARSGAGAQGIAQFMPATAREYGVNTADPVSSLDGAARMDAGLIKKYGIAGALSAYNSGNPNAYKDPSFAHGQTYNYVRSILGGQGSGGAGVATSPAAPAAAGQPDRSALLKALLGASSSGDYSGFFRAVQQSRQAPTPTLSAPPSGQTTGGATGEQPAFLKALQALAASQGKPLVINSGFRSIADQTRLWNARASNPNPVARPGSSLHEQGLAADGTLGGVPLGTLPPALLARYGLQAIPGDPVHIQARR